MDGIRTRVPLFWRELYFWGHRYGPFMKERKISRKFYERLVWGSNFGPFAFWGWSVDRGATTMVPFMKEIELFQKIV